MRLPYVSSSLVARTCNYAISKGSTWDTGIKQGILIATDRSNTEYASVWLVVGNTFTSKIHNGGENNDIGTAIYPLIWENGTLKIKSENTQANVVTAIAIGWKY